MSYDYQVGQVVSVVKEFDLKYEPRDLPDSIGDIPLGSVGTVEEIAQASDGTPDI